nr:zinc finger, CCHC-type [Tanacetum cinerariifolium]
MTIEATTSNLVKENPVTFQCLVLTSTHYTTWAIKMEAIMDAQGLWESIESAAGVAVDEKKSKMARAFIFQAIPKDILMQSEFEALRMKDRESIDEYAGKLSGMILKYNSVGATLNDEELVRKLFDMVTEKYIHLIASMEKHSDVEEMPFEEAIGRGRGDRYGKKPSQEGKHWNRKPRDKSHIKCFECQEFGHFALECRNKKKPEQEVHLMREMEEDTLLLCVKGEHLPSMVMLNENKVFPKLHESRNSSNRDMWYLDNGASNHMTGDKNLFAELNKSVTGRVWFGDGSTVEIKGKGTLMFQCKNGDQLMVSDVYFFSALTSNILSLGQLTEVGYDVWLHNEYLRVYNKQGTLVLKVQRSSNRLYKMALKVAKSACLAVSLVDDAWTWYARLGHANFYTLEMMGKKRLVTGMPCVTHPKLLCNGCVVAKKTRQSFLNEAQWRVSKPLELVHVDLCGSITPQSTGGSRYFLLIVDDWCRYMWVYLLRSKDEALAKFKIFKAQVEMETTHKVKVLRIDRGEAVRHAVYLLNRLPTKAGVKHTGCITKKSKRIVVARDVLFDEANSWTWEATQGSIGGGSGMAEQSPSSSSGIPFDSFNDTHVRRTRLLQEIYERKPMMTEEELAFLNGELKEEIYVTQPTGFEVKGKKEMVYKLNKALYGLRQAPRSWNAKLDKVLKELRFRRCAHEQAVYKLQSNSTTFIIGVYVDDIIMTGSSEKQIQDFKVKMNSIFDMSDLEKLNYYLGIEVKQEEDSIVINYSVGVVSKYMQSPKESHYVAVKKILRYLNGTTGYGLKYPKGGNGKICGYIDSSYASDIEDRISTTAVACQALWLRNMVSFLIGEGAQRVQLLVDNQSAIALMKNSMFHGRSKHIDTKYHFIRECVERDQIYVEHVSGNLQKADILTKALPRVKFTEMRRLIGTEDVNIKWENVD